MSRRRHAIATLAALALVAGACTRAEGETEVGAATAAADASGQDGRADAAPGLNGDWRTVPISNRQVAANPPGAVSAGPGLDTFYAVSTDGGATWACQPVLTVSPTPQHEQIRRRGTVVLGGCQSLRCDGRPVPTTWSWQIRLSAGRFAA